MVKAKRLVFTVFILFILLAIPPTAYSLINVINVPLLTSACSTPDNGDEIDEGFLGVGYENTWAETIGSGDTVDENFTLSGTPLSNSCTEGLNVVVDATGSYAEWNRGSTIAAATNIDVVCELYIDSAVVDAGTNAVIINWDNNQSPSGSACGFVRLLESGGSYYLDGASNAGTSADLLIAFDTWYTVTLHLDVTAASSSITVSGVGTESFTRGTSDGQYFRIGPAAGIDGGENADIEFGYVYINTP